MKFITSVLLFLFFQTGFSQNPLPSFNETAAWSFNYGFCQGCNPNTQQYLYLDGDTIYNGKTYKIVRRYAIVQPEWTDVNWTFQECINANQCDPNDLDPIYYKPSLSILLRESNDSIFKVGDVSQHPETTSPIQGIEKLFYVNNLNKGDRLTTNIHPAPGILVDSVKHKSIGGLSRRVTYLENEHQIIEGIGIYSPGGMTGYSGLVYAEINVSGVYLEELECFGEITIDSLSKTDNGNTFRTYSSCVRSYENVLSSEETISAFQFNVTTLKNGSLNLSTPVQKLHVFNSVGSLVYQSNTEQNQFTSVFKNDGVYILHIEKNNQIYYHKLFFQK